MRSLAPSVSWSRTKRLRQFLSRIWIRLLAFNVLLVFLPAAGFLYLDTYERQLLQAQERAMVQQGRLLAAALAKQVSLDVVPAERILIDLDQRLEARLRVVDLFCDELSPQPLHDRAARYRERGSVRHIAAWIVRLHHPRLVGRDHDYARLKR